MKALSIALKDLRRHFRSGVLLLMMFVVPLLITGLNYFAFGNLESGPNLQPVAVLVVDLDRPADTTGDGGFAAGPMLLEYLASPQLGDLLDVAAAPDEGSARDAVGRGEAAVAVIVPEGFSAAVAAPGRRAEIALYGDPTLTIGPGIVADLVRRFIDGFSGSKIAAEVVSRQLAGEGLPVDPLMGRRAAEDYAARLEADQGVAGGTPALLTVVDPAGRQEEAGMVARIMGLVMTGMMIFFVFFTGASTASSIIREHEEGTLPRLRATPTGAATILGGKFVGVMSTLTVQATVLVVAAALIFGVRWGRAPVVVLAILALVVAATGFGLWLMSLVRTSRQSGPVIGVGLTLTGMAGGLMTTGFANLPAVFDTVTLFTPQGWVLRTWKLSLAGAGAGEVWFPFAVALAIGAGFFLLGVQGMRRRFA